MIQYQIQVNQKGLPTQSIHFKIPEKEIKFAELLPILYELFDVLIKIELKSFKITCRKGCGCCCNQLVPVFIPEAFYLYDLISHMPPDQQHSIHKKFQSISACLKKKGFFSSSNNPMNNKDIDVDYFNLKLSCPFLEKNKCGIYKFRPFVCREYNLTSDPEFCKDPYHNLDSLNKIKIKRNLGALTAVFAARLYGLPPVPLPLSLVPTWVEEHKMLNIHKWPGEWLFETIINRLVTLNDETLELVLERKPE